MHDLETATIAISTKAVALHGVAALFGAFAHALNAHRSGSSKTWLDFLSLFIISSFAGTMFFLLGFYMFGQDNYLTIVMGGSGGWLGIEGLSFLVSFVKKSIKANFS
jgi:hypothetical protein